METIIYSAIAGGIFAVCGYFKNKKQKDYFVGFDFKAFLVTVIGSAAIGGASAYTGLAPDALTSSAFGVALYQFLRKALAAIPFVELFEFLTFWK